MSLLDRVLEKSRAPYTREDIQRFLEQYGPALKLLTWRNEAGEISGFALLTVPVPTLGHMTSQLVAVGTDGTEDALKRFEEVKQIAREMGAEVLIGATHRFNHKRIRSAFVRKFGGKIDSINLRWDLTNNGSDNGAQTDAPERMEEEVI